MISPFVRHHASFTTKGSACAGNDYQYNVNVSAGFIEVYSLQMKLANQRH